MKIRTFQQELWREFTRIIYPQLISPHSTGIVDKNERIKGKVSISCPKTRKVREPFLKAGIDIGCNIPHVILHGGIAGLQCGLYLADGMQNGGVILGKFVANVR